MRLCRATNKPFPDYALVCPYCKQETCLDPAAVVPPKAPEPAPVSPLPAAATPAPVNVPLPPATVPAMPPQPAPLPGSVSDMPVRAAPLMLYAYLGAAALLIAVGGVVTYLLLPETPEPTPSPTPGPVVVAAVTPPAPAPTPTPAPPAPAPKQETPPSPAPQPLSEDLRFLEGEVRRGQPEDPDIELAADAPLPNVAELVPLARLPRLEEPRLLLRPPVAGKAPKRAKTTAEQEKVYDAIVHSFILYDIGQLRGLPGRQAQMAFQGLGPDAIPSLARGLRYSSNLSYSCPVSEIRSKLMQLLPLCKDPEMLSAAMDALSRDVMPSRYQDYLQKAQQQVRDRLQETRADLRRRIPELIEALRDKEPEYRWNAANTLGTLGSDAVAAIGPLVAALRDSDEKVRAFAARALATLGAPAVPALINVVRDNASREAQSLACLALGQVRPASPEATAALVAALKHSDPAVWGGAHLALVELGETALPELRAALGRREPAAARVLGQLGPKAAAALPDLIAALKDPSKEFRLAVHAAIVGIGRPAVPVLVAALSDRDSRVVYSALLALGKIGPAAVEAVRDLLPLLKSPNRNIRILAVDALVKIDPDHEAVRGAREEFVPILLGALKHREPSLRAWSALLLGKLRAESATAPLLALVSDSEGLVRRAAVAALGQLGPLTPEAILTLIQALKDADRTVRTAAQESLTRIGAPAVAPLVAALGDAAEPLRAGAADVLVALGRAAVPALAEAAQNGESPVQRRAVAALLRIGANAEAAVPAFLVCLTSSDKEVRLPAAQALKLLRPTNPEALAALIRALPDPDTEVRATLQAVLAETGAAALPHLAAALNDPSTSVRRCVAETLRNLRSKAAAAIPALTEAVRTEREKDVRIELINALADVLTIPNPAALGSAEKAALTTLAEGLRDADPEIRITAHLALATLKKASVALVLPFLKDPAPDTRRLAVETLKRIGIEAQVAAPVLIRAIPGAPRDFVDEVVWALEAILPEQRSAIAALGKHLSGGLRAKGAPSSRPPDLQLAPLAILVALAASETGAGLTNVLTELERRPGDRAFVLLAAALTAEESDVQKTAEGLFFKRLSVKTDDKTEKMAAAKLDLAKNLASEKKKPAAREKLEEVVRQHPRTKAAEEARELLSR